MAGGPPSPAKRSFADVLSASASAKDVSFIKRPSLHRGEPALIFSKEEVLQMSTGLKFALVGKFSRGRPSMASLRKSFTTLDLKGSFHLGLLDSRHVLIRVNLEEDFLRLRLRKILSFDGFAMRLFRWTPQFRLDVESTWAPVWVRFDGLPLYMFNKGALFSLGSILGDPLKIDASTTSLARPSTARICVDIDIQQPRPSRIWLEDGDRGFWQSVDYDDVPPLCSFCSKIGHSGEKCNKRVTEKVSSSKLHWVPKVTEIPTVAAALTMANPSHVAGFVQTEVHSVDAAVAVHSTPIFNPISLPASHSVAAAVLNADIPATATIPAAVHEAAAAIAAVPTTAEFPAAVLDAAGATASVSAVPATVLVPEAADATAAISAAVILADFAAVPAEHGASSAQDVSAPSVFAPSVWCADSSPLPGTSTRLDKRSGDSNTDAVPKEKSYVDFLPGAQQLALSPQAPSFFPKDTAKSYAEILLNAKVIDTSSSVSIKPRFYAIKSAEYPSLPLPNFRIFFHARPQFPQDSLEEPSSPRPADLYQIYSEGDNVPRLPIPRKKLSVSLRASYQDFNAKLKKGRRPEFYPVNRKKWKKLAPYSLTDQTSTSNTYPNNAPDYQEHPTANPNTGDPREDSVVEYESNWHSSTSEDEEDLNPENLLGFEEDYLPSDYHDFSFALPLQTRRKYNKRFRDLPPPLPTRSSRHG